eukprot:8587290-Pyramimonas_sp.AAC.1
MPQPVNPAVGDRGEVLFNARVAGRGQLAAVAATFGLEGASAFTALDAAAAIDARGVAQRADRRRQPWCRLRTLPRSARRGAS